MRAGSLKAHIEDVRQYLNDNPDYDIFGVVESRFHSMLDDSVFKINGYSLTRPDRNTNSGGVALYIRDTFRFTLLTTSDITTVGKPDIKEYIMGFLNIANDEPIFISLVYRPPDVSLTKDPFFPTNLNSTLVTIQPKLSWVTSTRIYLKHRQTRLT